MRALLDVNVLIALIDAAHVHHRRASAWLAAHLAAGWASTPMTQNGCIRVMSQPQYPGPLPARSVAERLAEAAMHPSHAFWEDRISLLDPSRVAWDSVLGHRQVTDVYLLALAVDFGGRLVTFDRRIDHRAVEGAEARHLAVIA
jgi:toxin-antitoxin system PIN domain toxin